MSTLDLIKKHGLSIRQIPEVVHSLLIMSRFEKGDEIVTVEIPEKTQALVRREMERLKEPAETANYVEDPVTGKIRRRFAKKARIPKNAGYWMCKVSNHTSSTEHWDKKVDNLAPTLEKSIELFLSKL